MLHTIYLSSLTHLCYADRAKGELAEKAYIQEYMRDLDASAERKRQILKKLVIGSLADTSSYIRPKMEHPPR